MKGLVISLVRHERITTTEAKARELRPYMEKLVTKAKTNTVASKRMVLARVYNSPTATKKLFDVLAPKYADRKGGYTRILKLPVRKSDASKMAIIEFV